MLIFSVVLLMSFRKILEYTLKSCCAQTGAPDVYVHSHLISAPHRGEWSPLGPRRPPNAQRKEPPERTEQADAWASEAVWTFWRKEKLLLMPGLQPRIAHSVVSSLHYTGPEFRPRPLCCFMIHYGTHSPPIDCNHVMETDLVLGTHSSLESFKTDTEKGRSPLIADTLSHPQLRANTVASLSQLLTRRLFASLLVKNRGLPATSKQAGRNYFCQPAVTRPDMLSTVRDLSKYVVKVQSLYTANIISFERNFGYLARPLLCISHLLWFILRRCQYLRVYDK